MRIVSWNVNGIRACMTKGFMDFVNDVKPDILCLQETKINEELYILGMEEYNKFWNFAEKKGYSGTAIFTKEKPISVTYDMGIPHHDNEGRVICAEFEDYFLVDVYTPNAKRALERLDDRMAWDKDFLSYMKKLEEKKSVIFCGDLNVAHKEINLKNPQTNKTNKAKPGNAGFTDQEREGCDNILAAGFVDTFRHFYTDKEDAYSWWSYMFNARAKNVGWRIDYFCVTKDLMSRVKDAGIMPEVMGSDHCPVWIDLE